MSHDPDFAVAIDPDDPDGGMLVNQAIDHRHAPERVMSVVTPSGPIVAVTNPRHTTAWAQAVAMGDVAHPMQAMCLFVPAPETEDGKPDPGYDGSSDWSLSLAGDATQMAHMLALIVAGARDGGWDVIAFRQPMTDGDTMWGMAMRGHETVTPIAGDDDDSDNAVDNDTVEDIDNDDDSNDTVGAADAHDETDGGTAA